MANMGLRDLRLVSPREFDPTRVLRIAPHTESVMESLRLYDDLASALADAHWVVGTTARPRRRDQALLEPTSWAAEALARGVADNQRSALVFGREDRGLTNEELALCHARATIPTAGPHASLNLAQAVLIFSYELARTAAPAPADAPRAAPPTVAEREAVVQAWERVLEQTGFFRSVPSDIGVAPLRELLGARDLQPKQLNLLRSLAKHLERLK